MRREKRPLPERSPWKLLLWAAALGLLFGLVGFGEILEGNLRIGRNATHMHAPSGALAIVKIDDRSLHALGNWPWARRYHGQMVDRLTADGAKRILFDINFSFPTNPVDDGAFANALERSGRVVLMGRSKVGRLDGEQVNARPLPAFERNAEVATGSAQYDYRNAVWHLPYKKQLGSEMAPSLAAAAAGVDGPPDTQFPINYSIDVRRIPTYSAVDVLQGRVKASHFTGKTVIVGADSDIIGDRYFLPGYGRVGGIFINAAGAETLIAGRPVSLGWVPLFLFGLIISVLALRLKHRAGQFAVLGAGAIFLLVVPGLLEAAQIFTDLTPGLFVVTVVAGALVYRLARARGLVNPISNLPNLNALLAFRPGRRKAIVAARVLNYEEALATLPPDSERQLVEQIVSRLTVGDKNRVIYQGDGGIFAWFADPGDPFGNHLEALHALFRNPARVGKLSVDLSVTFGVEMGSGRSLSNRLASALVAADEAAREGFKWRHHDPETLANASWRLSMLSQLDEAIDKGEVWIAYQPKLELASRRIIGAEALARWTHPEKGPIAASEFITAAEQHNRIGKLTDFVLEQAIAGAAKLNREGNDFGIAVNMSAPLLSDKQFILRLSALLARHGLSPSQLTLELTETAALASTGEGLEMIGRLRDLGVHISIDDYGTGLSTLDYLKRVPASEIKIDQSFVKGIVDNRSDRLMVQSTIELAHSLDRRVVAEGAEMREIVDLLVEMGCDVAQGYAIGRPMSLESIAKRIAADRKRSAA